MPFSSLRRSRVFTASAATVVAASLLILVGCAGQPDTDSHSAPESTPTTTAPDPTPVPIETDLPTGLPFEVTITFEPTVTSSGQLTITATSNLPDGAELMTSLYSDAGYHGQVKAFLSDGAAVFGPFSDQGSAMPVGNYDFSISMSTASLQSAAVREYIGEEGELMTGPLVVASDESGSSYVSLDTILTVG